MAATLAQKRRHAETIRVAVRIVRARHPDVWAECYTAARALCGDTAGVSSN